MTHTLHRKGRRESLEKDYVFLAMAARGFNTTQAEPKLKEIFRIFARHKPVNMGDMFVEGGHPQCTARGASPEQIIKMASAKSIAHAVYIDKETVKKVLKDLKEADLGISIVLSGIFDETLRACKNISIDGPFTADLSLGVVGKTEYLPEDQILEILTMCGHSMVSKQLIGNEIEKVRNGEKTPTHAAKELARQCVCGVFNPIRAASLIQAISARAKCKSNKEK